MTPNAFALVLLLTYLAVTIIDGLTLPDQKRRAVLTLVILIASFVWVIGVPVIGTRS